MRPTFLATGLQSVRWTVTLEVADSRGGIARDTAEILVPMPGDATLDGRVTGADFTVWADHFGLTSAGFTDGDFDANGIVDADDLTVWATNYGESATYAPVIPSSIRTTLPPVTRPVEEILEGSARVSDQVRLIEASEAVRATSRLTDNFRPKRHAPSRSSAAIDTALIGVEDWRL